MSEVDEIDERRALIIAQDECVNPDATVHEIRRCNTFAGSGCNCLHRARAIRLSDETAGYEIHKKLPVSGVVNEKDKRS